LEEDESGKGRKRGEGELKVILFECRKSE